MKNKPIVNPILIVDDEKFFLESIELTLQTHGFSNLHLCEDPRKVMAVIEQIHPVLILLDFTMPYLNGETLLKRIKEFFPSISVIVLTALNDVEIAVTCTKLGALDYLVKPVEDNRLIITVNNALGYNELLHENNHLRRVLLSEKIENPQAFRHIITQSVTMISLFKYVEAIASSSQSVLITGETGVGKELFARAIHEVSGREGHYLTVNAAGLDDTVFSDTLFGHRKGAFTGADKDRGGLVNKASGGTLLLDEIGDLSPSSQVKLLRLIQDNEYYALGSDEVSRSLTRIICATNVEREHLHSGKKIRKDLYYRLSSHTIQIPPLRQRRDDFPILVSHFFKEATEKMGLKAMKVPKELTKKLSGYEFPGNIRELDSLIFDAVSQSRKSSAKLLEIIDKRLNQNRQFSAMKDIEADSNAGEKTELSFGGQVPAMDKGKEMLIQAALKKANNHYGMAADILNISRQTLYRYLKKKRLDRKRE